MNTLQNFLSPKLVALPAVPTDEIYPTYFLDNNDGVKDLILPWAFLFNDVLDAEKVHGALARLLEIGDWRKLGGRLRRGSGRTLELHVPKAFTKERPAVGYSHEVFNVKIGEHPLASKLPRRTDGASLQQDNSDFLPLAVRPDTPRTLAEFLSQDIPVLHLHIASFDDATMVTIIFPHVISDAMGVQGLLKAWSLVLAGREAEVPPLLGARDDVLHRAAKRKPQEPWLMEAKVLKGFWFFLFVVRLVWEIFSGPAVEGRTIFLPKEAMARLHEKALDEVTRESKGDEKRWVSEGDVLLAWLSQATAISLGRNRPITALGPVNMRTRITDTLQSDGVYVQNMALATYATFTPEDFKASLGHLAYQNRTAILQQTKPEQVYGHIRKACGIWDAGGEPASTMFGTHDALLFIVTNWTQAKFMDVIEFGPAVVRQGESDATRANSAGQPVNFYPMIFKLAPAVRHVVSVNGKDHYGNYWLYAVFPPQVWKVLEAQIRELA